MAKNTELENLVLGALFDCMKERVPSLSIMADNKAQGKAIIKATSNTMVDKNYKIRVHVSNYIGYGYDLKKKDEDGNSAKDVYENAVKNTMKMSGIEHFETFIGAGTKKDLGWYVTHI